MPPQKAIIVDSFGTSYPETREKNIGAIENDVREAYPDALVLRAFTSDIIRKKIEENEGEHVFNTQEALDHCLEQGIKNVYVLSTHLLPGHEYNGIIDTCVNYADKFDELHMVPPVMNSTADTREFAEVIDDIVDRGDADDITLFMGHGTDHEADERYDELDDALNDLARVDIIIGTVEGKRDFNYVLDQLAQKDVGLIYLLPLMVVAGDHAQNDMAGDSENSWLNMLLERRYAVRAVMKGLGEFKEVRDLWLEKLHDAIEGDPLDDIIMKEKENE